MEIQEMDALAHTNDFSPECIKIRLSAVRRMEGYTQKDFAEVVGVNVKTYNAMEKRGAPSIPVMTVILRRFRVDYNFLIYGLHAQLPADVRTRLFRSLASAKR